MVSAVAVADSDQEAVLTAVVLAQAEGLVAVAAVASADPEELGHMVEMVVLESVAPEGAVTEVASKVDSVDQEVVDMAAETEDTEVGSVESQED